MKPTRPTVRGRVLAAAAAAAAVGLAPATAAHARSATPHETKAGAHCIADLGGGPVRCFDSFTAAVGAATHGRVDDAPATARSAAGDRAFRSSLKGVIQGTFFEDVDYGGASLTIYGAQPCEKDGWVNYQYDLPSAWQNVISSVQPWAQCWLWLYPEPDLGGDRDGPFKVNTPDIGPFMNDRTKSIGFS